ncbi:MAG TPA: DUF3429 domain-containing protein [Burkholderiaceae bacterium]|nr:DUF3429 domain-containing protein [Burkholderiaceae bacterium]
MTDLSAPPAAAPGALAQALAYAGLLPFVAGALIASQSPAGAAWLLAYAATIVSFLGGIHWGLALRARPPGALSLVWGVTPSLLAWVALLLPVGAGLLLSAAALVTCYAVDRRLYAREGLSAWLALRLRLTSVASLACVAGAALFARA